MHWGTAQFLSAQPASSLPPRRDHSIIIFSFTCGMSNLHLCSRIKSLQSLSLSVLLSLSTLIPFFPPHSVQFACAQFERTLCSLALRPFSLQFLSPLVTFLLRQLGLAETWLTIESTAIRYTMAKHELISVTIRDLRTPEDTVCQMSNKTATSRVWVGTWTPRELATTWGFLSQTYRRLIQIKGRLDSVLKCALNIRHKAERLTLVSIHWLPALLSAPVSCCLQAPAITRLTGGENTHTNKHTYLKWAHTFLTIAKCIFNLSLVSLFFLLSSCLQLNVLGARDIWSHAFLL